MSKAKDFELLAEQYEGMQGEITSNEQGEIVSNEQGDDSNNVKTVSFQVTNMPMEIFQHVSKNLINLVNEQGERVGSLRFENGQAVYTSN